MSKIYIVISSTGEYEDYSETNLVAFNNEEDAKELVDLLKDEYSDCRDLNDEGYKKLYNDNYLDNKTYKVPVDYTGVSFSIEELELK